MAMYVSSGLQIWMLNVLLYSHFSGRRIAILGVSEILVSIVVICSFYVTRDLSLSVSLYGLIKFFSYGILLRNWFLGLSSFTVYAFVFLLPDEIAFYSIFFIPFGIVYICWYFVKLNSLDIK